MKWGVFVADIRPTVALMYDFDNTLCTKNMQEYSFIPKVNMRPEDFWNESNRRAREKKMDRILGYMFLMLDRAKVAKQRLERRFCCPWRKSCG
jgi:hypothetical protein